MREWRYISIFLNLSRRVVSFTHLPLYPQENRSRYPLYRRMDGTQGQSGHYGEQKNLILLPGIEP
jgi:hypothetical protein